MLMLLLIVFVLVVIFGNPHVGGQIVGPTYNYGYWPSGIGLILAILLVLYLFGGLRFR